MRFARIALIVTIALTSEAIASDEGNLSKAFREKYRLDEQGKIQTEGFAAADLNQSLISIDHSDLQAIKEINTTAFEQNDLNVSKLKQNKTDRNAEAVNLFFRSVEAKKRIDEQTRYILKDEAFGAYEYAGEYREIIDDRLNDLNNTVFSGQKANNNRYLESNEQIIIVISSSIPKSTIRSYFEDIDAIDAPFDVKFVLRGVIGSPETLTPTMEYITSIVTKGANKDKPFDLAAIKKRMEGNETIDTFKVKIDINPKVTRKYSIDRVPAVIYIRNYNQAIEEPKRLSEAINDNEEFYIAYGAVRLDYALAKINEKAQSKGVKRLIEALQRRGFYGEKAKEVNQTQTKENR
jgi:type-F conjugative transfer system pilin assembly protein TrbC